MGLREELAKRVERKQQEIQELELKIREANAYVQGLQDTLKLLPKETANGQPAGPVTLRAGSDVARTQEAIRKAGKSLHLLEILKAIGKPQDKKNRLALAGSLSRYARSGQVFVKTGPNTFGLLELGSRPDANGTAEPPDDFGTPDVA